MVEPELDSFSLTFPLPYRVAFIVVLGMKLHFSCRPFGLWSHGCKLTYSG